MQSRSRASPSARSSFYARTKQRLRVASVIGTSAVRDGGGASATTSTTMAASGHVIPRLVVAVVRSASEAGPIEACAASMPAHAAVARSLTWIAAKSGSARVSSFPRG